MSITRPERGRPPEPRMRSYPPPSSLKRQLVLSQPKSLRGRSQQGPAGRVAQGADSAVCVSLSRI